MAVFNSSDMVSVIVGGCFQTCLTFNEAVKLALNFNIGVCNSYLFSLGLNTQNTR